MRSVSRSLLLAGILCLGVVGSALAAPPHDGCPVGAGGGRSTIGPWELMTRDDLADAITATGGDPAQADGEFATHDRNDDGWLCTMTQVLPNDASGFDTWFVSRDNISAAR